MQGTIDIVDQIKSKVKNVKVEITNEQSSLFITIEKCIDHNPYGTPRYQVPYVLHRKFAREDICTMSDDEYKQKIEDFCDLFKREFSRRKKEIVDDIKCK